MLVVLGRERLMRALNRFDTAHTLELLDALGLALDDRMMLWKALSRLKAEGSVGRRGKGEYFAKRPALGARKPTSLPAGTLVSDGWQ